ncbi:MAG: YlbE-like family protein [Bacilli bacterium]
MRQDLWAVLSEKEEWVQYIRVEPKWYRLLSRNPEKFEQFEIDALAHHKKTITDHVDKVKSGVQFASFMVDMLGNLK